MTRIFLQNISNGNNEEQIVRAFKLATDICKADGSIKNLVIYVPTQKDIDHIGRVFGQKTLDDIVKGKGVKLFPNGPGVQILTDKTIQNCAILSTIIVATYVSYDTLTKADELHNCKAIIALPWLKDELNLWVDTWNPEIIDQEGSVVNANAAPKTISNPIVKKAIDEFKFTDIVHTSDRERFVTKFKIFKKYNIDFDTDEILGYLVREKHWTTDHANAVKEIGDKIKNGQRVNGGDLTYAKESLKRWSE